MIYLNKNKIKKVFLILAMCSSGVMADNPWEQFPDRVEGVKIIPTPENQVKYYSMLKTNGYVKEENKNALVLMKEIENAPDEIKRFIDDNPTDTHLRATKDSIPFTFSFPEIKASDTNKVFGFAPGASYVNGKWTGGVELFETNFGLGCALTINDIKTNHSGALIIDASNTSRVNNKVTTEFVSGNEKYGYLYMVSWYDNNFFRNLECASKTYDASVIHKMIEIAKRSDN